MRIFTALWAVVVATTLSALTGISAGSIEPADKVISEGHIDVGPHFENGEWTVRFRDINNKPYKYHPLTDLVIHAEDTAGITVPNNPAFGFLGTVGEKTWVIPQTQKEGITWLGWQTEDADIIKAVAKDVTWTVHDVTGPGTFDLFINSQFGKPDILFDHTAPWPQTTTIPSATHAHGNWAFSKQGTYVLDMEFAATGVDGKKLTARAPLKVHVGPNPEAAFAVDTGTTPGAGQDTTGATPEPAASASTDSGGMTWWVLGGGAVVVLIAVAFFATKRGGSRE